MCIKNYSDIVKQQSALISLFETVHDMVLVLDKDRKIIYFNSQFEKFAQEYSLNACLGITPGKAFNCMQALSGDDMCGKTNLCRYCGGNKVLVKGLLGEVALSKCNISAQNGNAFSLNVSASPIDINGHSFTIYCIADNSAEERRQMLERIFFHDVNNIANGMNLILESLLDSFERTDMDEMDHGLDVMQTAMKSLNNEINAQHILTLAEKEELSVRPCSICVDEVISEVADFVKASYMEDYITLETGPSVSGQTVHTDPIILKRVLTNMMKNACEASSPGQKVRIWAENSGEGLKIYVHNETAMTENISRFVFKRSFSTKGKGRGIGTYSMRLLTEKYLKGEISFSSKEGEGTTFNIHIPLRLPYRQ